MTSPAPWTRRITAWSLDGHVYHADCPPITTLVPLMLADPGWLVITTIRDPADRAHLYARVMPEYGEVTVPQAVIYEIADELLHSWTGWPGWTAVRIWRQTLEAWQGVDGQALAHAQDVLTLAPDRATTLAYSLLAERHHNDKDQGDRWRRALTDRPLDVVRREAEAARTEAAAEQDAADWRAMQSILQGMTR